jgi:hypothetical protein
MKWADALKASKIGRAFRQLDKIFSDDEPNIILIDKNFSKAPRLFRAIEQEAWTRIKLKEAKKYEDWEPLESPEPPYSNLFKNRVDNYMKNMQDAMTQSRAERPLDQ